MPIDPLTRPHSNAAVRGPGSAVGLAAFVALSVPPYSLDVDCSVCTLFFGQMRLMMLMTLRVALRHNAVSIGRIEELIQTSLYSGLWATDTLTLRATALLDRV